MHEVQYSRRRALVPSRSAPRRQYGALRCAPRGRRCLPLFVLDDRLLRAPDAGAPRVAFLAAVILMLSLRSTLAYGLELLSNGNFDDDATGWFGPAATYDASRDADGYASSGSVQIVNTGTMAFKPEFVSQCVPATAGTEYFFGGRVRFREDEVAAGSATIIAYGFPQPQCLGVSTGAAATPLLMTSAGRGLWLSMSLGTTSGGGFIAPVGTASLLFAVRLIKDPAGDTLTADFDRLYLAPVGTPVCGGLPATILGTSVSESLPGTSARDVIVGQGGDDILDGKGGNDLLCGGGGEDTLFGGAGFDLLKGGPKSDLLKGGFGGDILFGQGGDDQLVGGDGIDNCHGGAGTGDTASSCETLTGVP